MHSAIDKICQSARLGGPNTTANLSYIDDIYIERKLVALHTQNMPKGYSPPQRFASFYVLVDHGVVCWVDPGRTKGQTKGDAKNLTAENSIEEYPKADFIQILIRISQIICPEISAFST